MMMMIIIIIIIIVFIADLCFVWVILSSVYYFTKALYYSVWSSGTFLMSLLYLLIQDFSMLTTGPYVLTVATICAWEKKK